MRAMKKQSSLGFQNIYYKGRPVEPDLTPKTEYLVVARNWLHKWWLTRVRHIPVEKVVYLRAFKGNFDFTVDLAKSMPVPKQGRVVKATKAPEYEPVKSTKGGRVVRNIPKGLKKIKEAQEGKDEGR
jgi:hypothetical protein